VADSILVLDPVFWDDRYLKAQEEFIARLGRR
jgi:hypothetical protein